MKSANYFLRTLISLAFMSLLALPAPSVLASSVIWNVGDIFAGVGYGSYNIYTNAGVYTDNVYDGTGGFTTTPAFSPDGSKLYTINFSYGTIPVYDAAPPHALLKVVDTAASKAVGTPESIVFAANGHYFIGYSNGDGMIREYDAADTFVNSYAVQPENNGSDNIDLSSNQTTIFYTSAGKSIKRYDIITGQLADFATGLPGDYAFALRLLPPGDGSGGLLVANNTVIIRLNAAGAVAQTYAVAGETSWYALALDPNGTSFWAGAALTSNFYRFNIATGAVELGPVTTGGYLRGLAVLNEPKAAIAKKCAQFFLTGGGTMTSPDKCIKTELWSFGGNVGRDKNGNIVGKFEIVDHKNSLSYHARSFKDLSFTGPSAATPNTVVFTAVFAANKKGVADKTVTVTVKDIGEKSPKIDKIKLTGGLTLAETSLSGGNFQIHLVDKCKAITDDDEDDDDGSGSCHGGS